MESLKYRDASPGDLARIVNIYNTTISSRMVTADTEAVSVDSRLDWFHAHHPDTRPLWVIENDDQQVIGWVSFQSFYGRPAYRSTVEISIYLAPDARGKGIGKEVLKYAMDRARSLGIRTLLGFIFAHNEPSLRLFRSCGFEDWAHLPGVAELDGIERDLRILGKRVDGSRKA